MEENTNKDICGIFKSTRKSKEARKHSMHTYGLGIMKSRQGEIYFIYLAYLSGHLLTSFVLMLCGTFLFSLRTGTAGCLEHFFSFGSRHRVESTSLTN